MQSFKIYNVYSHFIHIKTKWGLLHLKPVCSLSAKKGSQNTFHCASRSTSRKESSWQHSGAPFFVSTESQDSRKGGRFCHWASLTAFFSLQHKHLVQLSSPPSEDLSCFQVWSGKPVSQCPHDRGWFPAVALHDTTVESLCSVGCSPSRPRQTSLSQWRGTHLHQTSPHSAGASWCGQSSSVPSHHQTQRPGSSVCRGGWSPQLEMSVPLPARPS